MSADVGTLAREAALLLDAVAQRLSAAREEGPAPQVCPTCGQDPSASCTSCPICRFLAVLRGERPEVTAKWIDGALSMVSALRAMMPPVGPEPSAGPQPDSKPTGLEHIDIE